jgi:Flp pilus assembly pilin Flp
VKDLIKKFADEELGNAVIDWTVLIAGAVMMVTAVVLAVVEPNAPVSDATGQIIETQPLAG